MIDAECSHELGQRTTQNEFTALGPYGFGTEPREDQARQVAEGELMESCRTHHQGVRAVATDIPMLVAGVGARQGAERHHSRHEPQIGVRFAGRDKLVYLIGNGEASPRRWWGFADRLDRSVQIGQGFTDGDQAVLLTLHALYSPMPVRQTHVLDHLSTAIFFHTF